MTPRLQRQYDAIMSMHLTLASMRRFHEYYISQNLARQFDVLNAALLQELKRIHDEAKQEKGA